MTTIASGVNGVEVATGKSTRLFDAPEASPYLPLRNVISAAWSPDGARVLVSFTNYSGQGGSLRVIDVEGKGQGAVEVGEPLRLKSQSRGMNGDGR